MVDRESYKLAEHFLAGYQVVHPDYMMELAQTIQDAVEDWLNEAERTGLIKEAE